MAEIEVKVRVKDFNPLVQKLEELGCKISVPVSQRDVIFTNGDTDWRTRNVIRIRNTKGRYILTLKRDWAGDELDCIELESEVSEPESVKEMLKMMGYNERVRVNKVRRKTRYGDFEVCLDQVEDLGDFMEIEKMSDADGEKVMEEIMEFMQTLGVDPMDRVRSGYDTLMEEKLGIK